MRFSIGSGAGGAVSAAGSAVGATVGAAVGAAVAVAVAGDGDGVALFVHAANTVIAMANARTNAKAFFIKKTLLVFEAVRFYFWFLLPLLSKPHQSHFQWG
jgi:hypothetical protein